MTKPTPKSRGGTREASLRRAWFEASAQCPFGPTFFLTQLRAFVRDRCPDPTESLPAVHLHLADGEYLDLCHVVGIGPKWVILAVNEPQVAGAPPVMRTEIIPYGLISRVSVRAMKTNPRGSGV